MIWDNYVGTDFLVPDIVCKNIIKIGENKLNHGFGTEETKYRKDNSLMLEKFGSYKRSPNFKIINNAIEHSLREFCYKFTYKMNPNLYEYPHHKFQKAGSGGGFYTWHCETSGDKECGKRAFVWMLYLNTVNNGGCTEFYKSKKDIVKIKPESGKFVFWPAGETHFHRSAPDLQETKYILTGWISRK